MSSVQRTSATPILGGSITVSHVLLDGQAVTPRHSAGVLTIPLAGPLQPGESVVFHLDFDVTVPTQGGSYYYGIFGYNSGILSLAHACPTVLVYNQDGWNNQLPDLDGDPLFSDTSFYLVSVDAPANLVLVGSGAEVQRSETAGRQQVLYADGPARDFYLAAAAGLVKISETVGEVTVNSYAFARDNQGSQNALDTAAAALPIYDSRYALYPYTEFDIVPIVTEAGGVEFPGMTAVASSVYGGVMGDWMEIVVAHELGHQWFYNLVGNETQGQPYLDESLVEFATWQYFTDRYGAAGTQEYQAEIDSTWYDRQAIPIGLPVSGYTSDGYVQIIYGRGALFFAALRDRMGAAVFDKFMKDYVQHFSWDIATTDTFKALAEQECGCDLTPLYQEWVYSK
jgi:aminopeptidase N